MRLPEGAANQLDMGDGRNTAADTELRFLQEPARLKLTNILDAGGGWKKLTQIITHPDHPERALFTADHVRILERETRRSPTDEILKTWSTTGRNRPKVSDFHRLLKATELHRAADIIAVDVFNEEATDTASFQESCLEQHQLEPTAPPLSGCSYGEMGYPDIPVFNYNGLRETTDNFSDIPVSSGGHKLGEGTFGVVYKGVLADGTMVAIKRLKEPLPSHYLPEVELLRKHAHPHLLPLLGVSRSNTREFCLIYQFMQQGSLQARLARENGTPAIDWRKRFSIVQDVASAIKFLHTRSPAPLVHRDIKSANVLLDNSLTAKLGDFGLIRELGRNATTRTNLVVGTTVYMAPETFLGMLSPKMDTFSFGVVIMEVLTGLAPYDDNRLQGKDIMTYIDEVYEHDITPALDVAAGYWDFILAKKLYDIGKTCIIPERKKRPSMETIYNDITQLNCNLQDGIAP